MANPAPGFEQHPGYEVSVEPLQATLSVHLGEHVIAQSTRAVTLLETKHRPVWYMPLEDIDQSIISRTDTDTYCPFKGHATYYTVTLTSGEKAEDAIWTYAAPYDECQNIAGYASFYTNKVDLRIDGELAEKSGPGWQS